MLRRAVTLLTLLSLSVNSLAFVQGAETAKRKKTNRDAAAAAEADSETAAKPSEEKPMPELETITFGAGCFWCIEAVLLKVKGVDSVVSGYMGGEFPNPTYEMVCTGQTGHAEVVQVKFDPEVLSRDELFEIFWQLHDPTTLNRQGHDIGTQYRSAIFYHTDDQKEAAEKSKQKWDESGKFRDPIVTEITRASEFYPAEDYHQNYFAKNPRNPYCRANIIPKLKKLDLLK